MRRRLLAVALVALAALASGCATKTITGKPTYETPAATGLAAKPLDEILTAVEKFAAKQKSVHINIHIDGKLFSDADVSYSGAEGITYLDEKKVQFRTVGETTYVLRSGSWFEADNDVADTIQQRTNFQDIVQEVYAFKKQIKDAKPETADVIVLSDGESTRIDVANDQDSPAMQAFHITTESEKDELVLSDWSEESLQLETPAVS